MIGCCGHHREQPPGKGESEMTQPQLRLRPYRLSDAQKIVTWCTDERGFYQMKGASINGVPGFWASIP